MLVIAGYIVVTVGIVVGYVAHGGKLGVLFQPTELVIIGGAALGAMMVSAPLPVLKAIIRQSTGAITKKSTSRAEYLEALMLLYEIIKTAKQNLLGLEAHVENPEGSDIFKKYPLILKNHHAMHFICDTLKVQISSPVSPYDLEDLMNADMGAAHKAEGAAPAVMANIADSMPGLGIVAAVLGVVITMGKLTQGKEIIGQSVAAALVGTFIGVLACYGFMGPLSKKMEADVENGGHIIEVLKQGLLAFSKDISPKVCVEFARRSVPPEERPTFNEVDEATQKVGKAA